MPRGQRTPEPDPADAELAIELLGQGKSRREVSDATGLTYYQLWRLEKPLVNEDERMKNIERLARNGWAVEEIARILEIKPAQARRYLAAHPVEVDEDAIKQEMEDEYARMLMERPE